MPNYKTSELTAGTEGDPALVAAVQNSADVKITLRGAAYKDAGTSGAGGNGQIPTLNSSGALAAEDGGTAQTAGPTGAGQYLGTPQGSQDLGWHDLPTLSLDDGAVTHAKLGPDCVEADNIKDDQLGTEHYKAGSVDHTALGADCCDGDNIQDDAVDTEHLADNSVGFAALDAGTATNGQVLTASVSGGTTTLGFQTPAAAAVADGSITGAKLAADAVSASSKVADDVIGSEHIKDGAVLHAALGSDCVEGDNIGDAQVDSEHLANDCVQSKHYEAGSVDATALAVDSVQAESIEDGAIRPAHINATTPTNGQILSAVVSGNSTTFDFIDNTANLSFANRAELRTATDTAKVINPAVIGRELNQVRTQFADLWSSYASSNVSTTINLSNSTLVVAHDSEGLSPSKTLGVENASTDDSRSVTLSAGSATIIGSTCSNLPSVTGKTYCIGATFLRAASERWMLAIFKASGETTGSDYRWFKLTSNAWVEVANDNIDLGWEPLATAGDYRAPIDNSGIHLPSSPISGSQVPWITLRDRRWLCVFTLHHSAASTYKVLSNSRTMGYTEKVLWSTNVAGGYTTLNSDQTLNTGEKFSDYENLYVLLRRSTYTYASGMISGDIVKDNTTEIGIGLPSGHGCFLRLKNDTTWFITWANQAGVAKIVGRKQFP